MTKKVIKQALFLTSLSFLSACGWVEVPLESPSASQAQSTTAIRPLGPNEIIVQKGDTLYGLSKRHQVPLQSLIRQNNIKAPFTLLAGQRLRLPRSKTHQVARGDTLYSLSQRYGTDLYSLARLNNLTPPYRLKVGQHLRLPTKDQSTTSTVAKGSEQPPSKATAAATITPPQKPNPRVKPKTQITKNTLAKPPSRTGSQFAWPLQGKIISKYGTKKGGLHNDGINIAAPLGTPVKAAESGIVAYSGNELRGFGNMILVKHQGGWITAYAHTESISVKRGDTVRKGQQIATVGKTGSVTSPQLHFEIRQKMAPVNPITYLN